MDERLKYMSLPGAFSKVMTDLADLIQKEMRLARAELSAKLSIGIRAGAWMFVAAFLATMAALLAGLRPRPRRCHRPGAALEQPNRGSRSRSHCRSIVCK